jgi:antirestriction protein
MAYYADEERALDAVADLLDLLEEHDAVGLFHLSAEVHDDADVRAFEDLFDGVIRLDADGTVESEF